MDNIDVLLNAYKTTDRVFQEIGYDPYEVDLLRYIRKGDLLVFTSTDGARESIANIPYDEMILSVKKAIIDGTIQTYKDPNGIVDSEINFIPGIVGDWAKYNIDNPEINNPSDAYDFEQAYDMIINTRRNYSLANLAMFNILVRSRRKIDNQRGLPERVAKIIDYLEKEKERMFKETRNR